MLQENEFALHEDNNQFLAAIEFTAAQTGFQPELIEKDYYCSLLLKDFSEKSKNTLIFKGGTLLAKAHAGFYRLSEDLDFTISISPSASRTERSQSVVHIKSFVNTLSDRLSYFVVGRKLTGSNESRQYNAEINYTSCLSLKQNRILVEIGLREKIQYDPLNAKMNTLILNPFTREPYVTPFYFRSLSVLEAYAEKMRAALTRKKLAIRDFYDLYYAIQNNILKIENKDFIDLLKQKLFLPNTTLIEFDNEQMSLLSSKVATELMPTLIQNKALNFDLEQIFSYLKNFARAHLVCKN